MLLKIKIFGSPILQKQAETVSEFDKKVKKLAYDMIDTLKNVGGLGLSAPQVGISKQIIVVRFKIEGAEIIDDYSAIINPQLTISGDNVVIEEGCLSFPGIFVKIPRKRFTEVAGFNTNGKFVTGSFEELNARILQHEVDHLNGILITDRISRFTRMIINSKLNNLSKVGKK
ncbi:MAG: peptide deformylase [bacterium]